MGCCGSAQTENRNNHKIDSYMKDDDKAERYAKKLLLLGTGSSGKSTLFKALKSSLEKGISRIELENTKYAIRQNVVSGIITLLQQSQIVFESDTELNSDCQIMINDNIKQCIHIIVDASENYFSLDSTAIERQQNPNISLVPLSNAIHIIWKLPAIQSTFRKRGGRFSIPDNMDYFFDKVQIIMEQQYFPNEDDALRTRVRTIGMIDYVYEAMKDTFHIYDVGGQRNERRKWIHHFHNVDALLFVTALNHYNAVLFEDNSVNAMRESVDLFEQIITQKWFRLSEIILILNKDDLFQILLRDEQIPLTVCFSEKQHWPIEDEWYEGPNYYFDKNRSEEEDDQIFTECYNSAIKFIQSVYKSRNQHKNKTLYTHVTCATDNNNVKKVFWDVQNIVIRRNMAMSGMMMGTGAVGSSGNLSNSAPQSPINLNNTSSGNKGNQLRSSHQLSIQNHSNDDNDSGITFSNKNIPN